MAVPDGDIVEGKHIAAWPYDLCRRIERNRELLGTNRHARPRRGLIHAFSGLSFCIHCGRPLTTRTQRYYGRDVTYTYYACQTPKLHGIQCAAESDRRHCAVRTELLEQQFGTVLGWLGSWSTDAIAQIKAGIAQIKAGYETLAEAGGDLSEEYERKRAELSRRKANLSRQYELGLLDDTQLMARLAEIRHAEGQLHAPATTSIRSRWEDALRTMRALESLGAQWQEASEAGEHVFCHRMAFALLQGVYVDLLQGRMVGLWPKPDVYVSMKHRLAEHGWREREVGLLWNDIPDEFATRLARTHYEDVVEALRGGVTTTREIAAHLGMHYNNVHRVLRRLVHEGVVRAEQIPNAGRKHLRFEYLGPARPQLAEPKLQPGAPSSLAP